MASPVPSTQPPRAKEPRAKEPMANGPPDLNSGLYPFDVVVDLLQRNALFHWYGKPQRIGSEIPLRGRGGEIIGFRLGNGLHPLRADLCPPDGTTGLRAVNAIAPEIGISEQRWMLIPDDYVAHRHQEPPETLLQVDGGQRFAMLDAIYRLGSSGDGFKGFGSGRLYPLDGNRWLVGAVGNLDEGFGRFEGLEGTYTVNGELDLDVGFRGSVLLRIQNAPDDLLTTSGEVPHQPLTDDPDATYLLVHGRKTGEESKTQILIGSDGRPQGFELGQELTQQYLYSTGGSDHSPRIRAEVGRVVGSMRSKVFLNILDPGAPGTAEAPIPFSSRNRFYLVDSQGNETASFVATGGEGRSFVLTLDGAPAQQALRFGAFQEVVDGTGALLGARGLLTDNSAVGVSPHATSTLYLIRLVDPQGRYRGCLER